MGRAGRPQYDSKGVAVIMVHDPKKAFYKRFLYEPFPVESSLADQVGVGPGGRQGDGFIVKQAVCSYSPACHTACTLLWLLPLSTMVAYQFSPRWWCDRSKVCLGLGLSCLTLRVLPVPCRLAAAGRPLEC